MRSTLHPHQAHALDLLKYSFLAGHRRPMVKAPTGFGKTILAAAIVEGALAKGNRVLFTVPAISLINQTVEAFHREGISEVGVIQADHPLTDMTKPVQVASVQSLARRTIPDVDVVVLDEAHRWFKFYETWMGQDFWNPVPFIGLSATPWTKGLGRHFDDLIVAANTDELIERGYLSDFEVFVPSHPDLSKVRTVAGDYHEGDLSKIMQDAKLVGDVVEAWLKLGNGEPTLCFAVDRAHARKLQNEFHRVGVNAGYVDANTSLDERAEIAADFKVGAVPVVVNVGVLTTGVDWDVRCLILARPTKSKILFTQIIGRALRTAEGKGKARILDHSDTHLRLGMVTSVDRNNNTLCPGRGQKNELRRGREEPKPVECTECSYLKPPKTPVCPNCGFAPQKQSEIESAAGELAQLQGKAPVVSDAEKKRFFRMLRGYAWKHQKTERWIKAKYKTRFNSWPNFRVDIDPMEPSPEVIGWIRHTNIKWAKSQKKRAAA